MCLKITIQKSGLKFFYSQIWSPSIKTLIHFHNSLSLQYLSLVSSLPSPFSLYEFNKSRTPRCCQPITYLQSISPRMNSNRRELRHYFTHIVRLQIHPFIFFFLFFFLIIFEWCGDWRIGGGGVRCSGDVLLWCL